MDQEEIHGLDKCGNSVENSPTGLDKFWTGILFPDTPSLIQIFTLSPTKVPLMLPSLLPNLWADSLPQMSVGLPQSTAAMRTFVPLTAVPMVGVCTPQSIAKLLWWQPWVSVLWHWLWWWCLHCRLFLLTVASNIKECQAYFKKSTLVCTIRLPSDWLDVATTYHLLPAQYPACRTGTNIPTEDLFDNRGAMETTEDVFAWWFVAGSLMFLQNCFVAASGSVFEKLKTKAEKDEWRSVLSNFCIVCLVCGGGFSRLGWIRLHGHSSCGPPSDDGINLG